MWVLLIFFVVGSEFHVETIEGFQTEELCRIAEEDMNVDSGTGELNRRIRAKCLQTGIEAI